MTIAARPQGLSDVAAGRLDRDDPRQRTSPTSIRRSRVSRGQGRGGALLFLLRRALPAGLPDLDRHSAVHPPDRRRQPRRRGEDDLRLQHPGRHVRPRLPDRDAVRGGLRARGGRGQAGADRAPAALRDRRADRDGQVALHARPRRRASAWRSSARGRRASPAPMRSRSPASTSRSSRRAASPAASTNTASPPTRPSTTSRRRKPPSSCRSAGSRCSTASRSASTSRSTSCGATTTPCSSAWASAATNKLGLPGETELENVVDAVDYIARPAPGGGQDDAAGRPAGRRHRRRHDGDRHRRAVEEARRRERHDRLPARRGAA